MDETFGITAAQTVAVFIESVLYGIYLVSLGYCLRALLFDPHSHGLQWKKEINFVMLTVTLLLWVVSTLDLALGLRHNLEAFVYYSGPGGPTAVFLEISSWINIMKASELLKI